eukprot:364447-Chlamydomonas_euryale.AAC.27
MLGVGPTPPGCGLPMSCMHDDTAGAGARPPSVAPGTIAAQARACRLPPANCRRGRLDVFFSRPETCTRALMR